MNLTQDEVAERIKTSPPYVGHLESGKRNPSDSIVTRLAEMLGFDQRELFFLANPHTEAILATPPETAEGSVLALVIERQILPNLTPGVEFFSRHLAGSRRSI